MARSAPILSTVDAEGRLALPATLRGRLGLHPGVEAVLTECDGRLLVESRAGVLERLQERFRTLPAGTSLADELIQERRREAARESG